MRTSTTLPEQQIIELNQVRFAWPKQAPLLDIEAFAVRRGERVFLSGPSGSGKSTFLNLLGGVVRPRSGTVRILGTDASALSGRRMDAFRADHIGFVFQMFNLVPYLSVLENVMLPCQFSKSRANSAVSRSGSLRADAQRLLDALELPGAIVNGRNVNAMSIGQQQRVAVARALIGAPEIVIADEPTSALDEDTRERFIELLFCECEARGTTLLLVSHDRRLGKLFDSEVSLLEINRASTTQ